jgi:hypothetical protein
MSDPMLRDQWSKLDSKSTGKVSKSDFERFRTTQGNLGSSTTSKSSTGANAMSGSTGNTSSPKK